jgi:hypothetical protein
MITPALEETLRIALETMSRRVPRRLITRPDIANAAKRIDYLYRAYLEGHEAADDQPGLLLHKFVASDEKKRLHSHPWKWAFSFIAAGSYLEHRSKQDPDKPKPTDAVIFGERQEKIFVPGDINVLTEDDFHRVEILTPEVWTFFIHGPRCQTWAFADEVYGQESRLSYVHARTFQALKEVGSPKEE